MTILGMAALSSLAMAAALAGCSSGTYSTGKHAGQLSNVDLAPSKVDYAPNQSAPRTIGRVVTTRGCDSVYVRRGSEWQIQLL